MESAIRMKWHLCASQCIWSMQMYTVGQQKTIRQQGTFPTLPWEVHFSCTTETLCSCNKQTMINVLICFFPLLFDSTLHLQQMFFLAVMSAIALRDMKNSQFQIFGQTAAQQKEFSMKKCHFIHATKFEAVKTWVVVLKELKAHTNKANKIKGQTPPPFTKKNSPSWSTQKDQLSKYYILKIYLQRLWQHLPGLTSPDRRQSQAMA